MLVPGLRFVRHLQVIIEEPPEWEVEHQQWLAQYRTDPRKEYPQEFINPKGVAGGSVNALLHLLRASQSSSTDSGERGDLANQGVLHRIDQRTGSIVGCRVATHLHCGSQDPE